jgi:hypothetical protein
MSRRHDPWHRPMDEEVRATGNQIGNLIGTALPAGWGFALLLFPLGDGDGRMNYISNADRDTMRTAMRELLDRWDGATILQDGPTP